MRRVGHVGGDAGRAREGAQVVLAPAAAGEHGALEQVGQERTAGPTLGAAADLLMVEERYHQHVARRVGGGGGSPDERAQGDEAGEEVVQAWGAQEVLVPARERRGGRVVAHRVPARDGVRLDVELGRQESPEAALVRRALAEDRRHVGLGVELEPLGVDLAVQVDRELGDAQHGAVDAKEAALGRLAPSRPRRGRRGPGRGRATSPRALLRRPRPRAGEPPPSRCPAEA